MRFNSHHLAVAFLMVFAAVPPLLSQKKPCPNLIEGISDKKFQPGQVWSYRTRPSEVDSILTVLRVDNYVKGAVVHVRVDGLNAHNPRGDKIEAVEHMPFSRDAMLASVERLLKTNQPLPSLEGLDRWRSDCGGVYTISVRDAVDVMEKTLNNGHQVLK